MPRGNDATAAAQDLTAAGAAVMNAEALIAESTLRLDPEVTALSMKAIDPEKTADLDLSKPKVDVPDGHKILSGSVRGDGVVYVVQDETGRTYKAAAGLTRDYEAPELSAEAAALRARATAERERNADLSELAEARDEAIAKANAEYAEAAAEATAKAEEEAAEGAAEAQEEAEQAESEGSKGSKGTGDATGTTDSQQGGGPKRAGKDARTRK